MTVLITLQHLIVDYQPLYQSTEYAHAVITFSNLAIIAITSCVLLNVVHESLMVTFLWFIIFVKTILDKFTIESSTLVYS